MINLLKADFYQIIKSKSMWVYMFVSLLGAVSVAVVLRLIQTGALSTEAGTTVSMFVDTMLVSLLGAIVIGHVICRDFETKNIHDQIISGNGRTAILYVKVISSAFVVFLVTLPYALVAIIGFASGIEFAPLVGIPSQFFEFLSNAGGYAPTAENILRVALLSLLLIVMYVARLSICIPIAFKTKRPIIVTMVGFMSAFVFDVISALTAKVDGLAEFFNRLPYAMTLELNMDASIETMITAILSALVFTSIMASIAGHIFRKAEIK